MGKHLTLQDRLLLLKEAAEEHSTISFRAILHILSGKGRLLILMILSLPFCFPLLPGMSIPFGLIIFFIGIRIAFEKNGKVDPSPVPLDECSSNDEDCQWYRPLPIWLSSCLADSYPFLEHPCSLRLLHPLFWHHRRRWGLHSTGTFNIFNYHSYLHPNRNYNPFDVLV